jgi:hypothetical protein
VVSATLSRLTLQPSPSAHVVVIVFVPACRWTVSVVVFHVSQSAVGAKLSDPAAASFADAVSVRVTEPPLA